MAGEDLTYAELLQILEVIKAIPRFSEVHLKVGDIEIDVVRDAPQADRGPAADPSTAEAAGVKPDPSARRP